MIPHCCFLFGLPTHEAISHLDSASHDAISGLDVGMTMGLDAEMVTPPIIVAKNLFNVSVDYVDETQDQDKVLRTTHGVAHDSFKDTNHAN